MRRGAGFCVYSGGRVLEFGGPVEMRREKSYSRQGGSLRVFSLNL